MKILVFNGGGIGDAVMGSVMLADVRRQHPDDEIHCVVSGLPQHELVERLGLCNEVSIEPIKRIWKGKSADSSLSFICRLRQIGNDLSFMTYQSRGFWNSFAMYTAGIKERFGFRQIKSMPFLNRSIPIAPARHVVQYNADLLRLAGIKPTLKYPELKQYDDEKEYADRFLYESGLTSNSMVFLHGGASQRGLAKRVSAEKLVDIGLNILDRHPELRFIYPDVDEYEDAVSFGKISAIPIPVKQGILYTAAVLRKAALCISSDSAVMHLAGLCGIPVVGLFGPTDPSHTGPFSDNSRIVKSDRNCSPCTSYRDTGIDASHLAECRCTSFIDSHTAAEAALELLKQNHE